MDLCGFAHEGWSRVYVKISIYVFVDLYANILIFTIYAFIATTKAIAVQVNMSYLAPSVYITKAVKHFAIIVLVIVLLLLNHNSGSVRLKSRLSISPTIQHSKSSIHDMAGDPETFQLHVQPPSGASPPISFCKSATSISRLQYQQPPSSANTQTSEFAESNVRETTYRNSPHLFGDAPSECPSSAISAISPSSSADIHPSECLESSERQTTCHDTPHLLENPSLQLGTTANSSSAANAIPASPKSVSRNRASRAEVLSLIFKQTAAWIFAGIGVMVLGIGFSQAVILPRIHICLFDPNCPLPFDVGVTNAITLLQTLMHYWLQAGMLIASVGLLKLSAYQAWFVLMDDGNTIDNLDLNLGAIRGNLLDTARLAFRKRSLWLSVYVLGHIGIGTAISLIVALSIIREGGTHAFNYPSTIQFPNSSVEHINNPGQLRANAEVSAWAMQGDTSHSSAHRGSLVIPDARNGSTDSRACGPRIKGALSCTGLNNYTISHRDSYTLHIDGKKYYAISSMKLAQSVVKVDRAEVTYIWISDTAGILPNATQTSDGQMNMALCTHSVHFLNDTKHTEGIQEIQPSTPLTSGCLDTDPDVCVSDAVSTAILCWWGGLGTTMWGVNCRGSVLGPLPRLGENNCTLTEGLWSETVTSMLDALVRVGDKGMNTQQTLIVPGATVNARRWWLQALVPFLTFVLYGAGLCYTTVLSQGRNILKGLTLTEIVGAAQTEYVRALLDSGSLAKAMVQYESETGFTIPSPSRTGKRHVEKPA